MPPAVCHCVNQLNATGGGRPSPNLSSTSVSFSGQIRCGNVAAILELDEHLQREFIIFEAAPQETRGIPSKKPVADYFL